MTLKHSFTNLIADDGAAIAAGETLPSHWNADHVLDSLDTQVLFNDGGTVGGAEGLLYGKTTKKVAVGNAADLSASASLGITQTGVDFSWYGAYVNLTLAPPSPSTTSLIYGLYTNVANSDANSAGSLYGAAFNVIGNAGTAIYGTQLAVTFSVGGATLPDLFGLDISAGNSCASDITRAYGIRVRSLTSTGGGALTTAYGLKVDDQAVGGTVYNCWFGAGLYHFDALTASSVVLTTAGKNLTSVALAGDTTKYLNEAGAFTVPTGSGTGTVTHTGGALTAGSLVIGAGADDIAVTTTGTGIVTALGVNVGSAGAPVLFNGAGGTPSSLVGTNITGTAAGLTAGAATVAGSATVAAGVTVADAGGDTTTWPLLATSQTGDQTPATDAGLTYNATTNALSATTFIGALTGSASSDLPLAGGTMSGPITLGENTSIALDPAGSADGKYSGITVTGTGGATIAFGDLITLDKDDSRWELVDISVAAAATGDARGILGMAVTSSTDGGALTILLNGIIRADANFPALTIGAAVFASTTGDIVVAQPTTTDHVIRIVGYALTADEIYFNAGNVWTTHV